MRPQLPFVLLKTSKSTHVLVEVSVDGRVSYLLLPELFRFLCIFLFILSIVVLTLAPMLPASSRGVRFLTAVRYWQEALLHIDREFELQDDVAILRSMPEFSHITLVCLRYTQHESLVHHRMRSCLGLSMASLTWKMFLWMSCYSSHV